ncbi:guanine nucleotide exchange protein smcr8a-like [Anguilla anguilla]|uniref:guanine nucleotide exchange protein smcr8a-like n=1 Tax=Anguilla anguilla TaxID=7936 RepID=UPI0015A90DE1|nr:guanine nucleotide exchange protein smcr8a-like [Anguilla anguilla]
MIGSPDLVAFTKDDDFGEAYVDPCLLPEEFSVPLFTHAGNSNPWSKTSYAKFARDFILISEFSEQVGPQPLLTIPDESKVCGTFDLNYFSLRIMSVDYQASFVGHPPGCNYPKLNFVEDSKVVLGDSKEGAFAYVHHLTLYDLEARGFVRPFCMAYISADERKIMQQFQELSAEFSKASECLKTGNRKAFASELVKKLKDLEYTRTVLHKETELQKKNSGCYSTQVIDKANELANVEKSIYEHRDLLRQITSYPSRKRRDCEFSQESDNPANTAEMDKKPTPTECSPEGTAEVIGGKRRPSYTPQLIKGKSAKCFDKRLKTLEELCDSYFFHQTMEQLRLIESAFRGDLCYIYTNRINQALLKKQKITNFLYEECSDWEDEAAAVVSKLSLAGNLPPPPTSLLSADLPSPAVTHANVEAAASDVEKLPEAELTESSPSDLTQENSDEGTDAETKGSRRSSGENVVVTGPEGRERNSEIPVDLRAFCGEAVEGDSVSTGTEGEDAAEQVSATDLSTPEHRGASYRSAAYEQEPSVKVDGDAGATHEPESPDLTPDVDSNDDGVSETGAAVRADASCCMGQERLQHEDASPEPAEDGFADKVVKQEPQSCLQGDLALGKAAISEAPPAGLSPYELNSDGLPDEMFRLNLDDISDTTSFMSTSTNSDRLSSPCHYSNPVTMKQKKRAGQSALRFIRQYPFSQQAIFCVLTGRTLVVVGTDEKTVRKLVNALSIFVPNHGKYGETIQPWLSSPFQLTDLQNWKLIGLHRMASPTGSSMLHSLSRYARYIAVLDADQKTLRCPPYGGSLIGCMANHRTQIKRGSTYFMHVHCVLTQLCSKAFLYTFCHHLHLPISLSEDPGCVASRRSGFLHQQLGYGEEDSRVIQFLSELIKQSYLQGPGRTVGPPTFRFSYIPSFLHKI